jgi:tetratricopeptide (TPR) repeat protein
MRMAALALVGAPLLFVISCASERPLVIVHQSAARHMDLRQHDLAAREYEEIARRAPGDWLAQASLGRCLLALDRPDQARPTLEIAHTLRPQDDSIANDLAEAMYRQGDETSLFAFVNLRARRSRTADAWLRVAHYAEACGDADTAKLALETAIELDEGRSVEPYLRAAAFAEAMGDLDMAVRRLRQGYGIDPFDGRVSERLVALGEVPGPTGALPPGR